VIVACFCGAVVSGPVVTICPNCLERVPLGDDVNSKVAMRVLVTGSSGHLARHVIPLLEFAGHEVIPYDLPDNDVLDYAKLGRAAASADWCVHLAGLKYADRAETDPLPTVDVNVHGTANVVGAFGPNVVLASTCKAADPETVYGCSKLIAERIVLDAGGRVARLVNVLGSVGSVTEIWEAVPADKPLPVCDATRLFIENQQAADLLVSAVEWPPGRYGPHAPARRKMSEVGAVLYPGREQAEIPLRRGDRKHERLFADCEWTEYWTRRFVRIVGAHDPRRDDAAKNRSNSGDRAPARNEGLVV
jgi:hypothetical protein